VVTSKQEKRCCSGYALTKVHIDAPKGGILDNCDYSEALPPGVLQCQSLNNRGGKHLDSLNNANHAKMRVETVDYVSWESIQKRPRVEQKKDK